MKKTLIVISLILFLLASACNSTTAVEATSPDVPEINGTLVPGDVPVLSENLLLAVGTLKLEETEYSVDVEQAQQLLPLWKALRSLSQSESVAAEELDAIFTQIRETMSSEQIGAIDAMQLTREDFAALMQEYGLSQGLGQSGDISPERQATAQAMRESGQLPQGAGGFFPGQGGGPGGGQGFGEGGIPPDQFNQDSANTERLRSARGLNSPIYDVVIGLLESK